MRGGWGVGVIAALSLIAAPVRAQLPQVDIYYVRLAYGTEGATADTVINLTNHPGYDNQPMMVYMDVPKLFYTSVRDGDQADIWCRDLVFDSPDIHEHRVTSTPESEYSPTQCPPGDGLSVVRVEADSSQRLVHIGFDGEDPTRLLTQFPDLAKIGYHAWIDSTRVALFILGEPNELWIADMKKREKWQVAGDIGRCLRLIPWEKNPTISFTRTVGDSAFLEQVDIVTRKVTRLMPMPAKDVQDYAFHWLGGELEAHFVLCTQGSKIQWAPWRGAQNGWDHWSLWVDLAPFGLSSLTRIQGAQSGVNGRDWGLLVVATDPK